MLEQQCPAKVLRRKTKTDEVKCGLASCSALNIPVVWQWRWWWAKSNWLSLSLFPERWFYPPWLSRTQTAYKLLSHLPSSQPEHQPRLAWKYSRRETTDQRTYRTVRETYPREASGLSLYLSVCLIDWPPYHNCTPRDCSERLPFWWTSSFF